MTRLTGSQQRLRPRVKGYLPCRIVTGRVNCRGQVLVQFADGLRNWLPVEKVDTK